MTLGFGMRDPAHRVERYCDVCGKMDTDPRHVQALPDGTTVDRHMDCCRSRGCDICVSVTAGAEDLRGDDLVAHLTKD